MTEDVPIPPRDTSSCYKNKHPPAGDSSSSNSPDPGSLGNICAAPVPCRRHIPSLCTAGTAEPRSCPSQGFINCRFSLFLYDKRLITVPRPLCPCALRTRGSCGRAGLPPEPPLSLCRAREGRAAPAPCLQKAQLGPDRLHIKGFPGTPREAVGDRVGLVLPLVPHGQAVPPSWVVIV